MKIIIPMSGTGNRFLRAGYNTPKPLLLVDGKPIIEHVVGLFGAEQDFVFICNNDHLKNTDLEKVLKKLKPEGKIVSIDRHEKGPVFAIAQAFDLIDNDDEEVIVSYCDYSMRWDYADFKQMVKQSDCDACLPAYTGFHPHLLPVDNLYAGIKVDNNGYMEEIKEKYSFTADKTKCHHSPGAHYFKKGSLVKKYFQQMMDEDINLKGEYYVSLVFNLLKRDGLKTLVYDKIPHFCQWGTPEDLEQYEAWSRLFAGLTGRPKGHTDIPPSREKLVRIDLDPELEDYKKVYEYWKNYFKL